MTGPGSKNVLPGVVEPELRAVGVGQAQEGFIGSIPDTQDWRAAFVGIGTDISQFLFARDEHGVRIRKRIEMKSHVARTIRNNRGRNYRRHSENTNGGVDEQAEDGVGKIQEAIVPKPLKSAKKS